MKMEAIRVQNNLQQLAGVFYVRQEGMLEYKIPLAFEFGEDALDTEYILVLDGEVPVATCRIHLLPENGYAKIERVVTTHADRGKGAGRLAIEAAEEWIRESGYTRILISSRESAVGFYEKLGYTADYDSAEGSGDFRLIMVEKSLPVQA
jgi:GNAT superfamily N-acetyltransferase